MRDLSLELSLVFAIQLARRKTEVNLGLIKARKNGELVWGIHQNVAEKLNSSVGLIPAVL